MSPADSGLTAMERARLAWDRAGQPGQAPERFDELEVYMLAMSRGNRDRLKTLADKLCATGDYSGGILLETLVAAWEIARVSQASPLAAPDAPPPASGAANPITGRPW